MPPDSEPFVDADQASPDQRIEDVSRDESAGTSSEAPVASPAGESAIGRGGGAWIVVPTYNEAENLPDIVTAILAQLPDAAVLVVDDNSPDGSGAIAEDLAAHDHRIHVCHRQRKEGLGPAYLEGFGIALAAGATAIVEMDADWSHDPAALPGLLAPIEKGTADVVIGSRYAREGRVVDWGIGRRAISRGGSLYSRIVLGISISDFTGGFNAWRAETLRQVPFEGIHAGGYVFQIELKYKAARTGARVVEVPITFRDRRVGSSKMSRRIVAEALLVVVQLRWEGSGVRRLLHSRRNGQ